MGYMSFVHCQFPCLVLLRLRNLSEADTCMLPRSPRASRRLNDFDLFPPSTQVDSFLPPCLFLQRDSAATVFVIKNQISISRFPVARSKDADRQERRKEKPNAFPCSARAGVSPGTRASTLFCPPSTGQPKPDSFLPPLSSIPSFI